MIRFAFALGAALVGTVAFAQAPVALPASANSAKELEPLAFMAGRWLAVTPNKLVNEEHWMSPRGQAMVGTFRQVRRDGKNAFTEVSLISVEKEGVRLRLRHMHGQLEIPEERKEPNDFMLVKTGRNWAEFAGTGASKDVTSVVYRLRTANHLEVITQFAPTSREKGYTLHYFREGSK
jgi:hypothetical protein